MNKPMLTPRRFVLLCTLTLLPALALSWQAHAAADKNTRAIRAKVGDQFSITLEANSITGFNWTLAQPVDENVAKLLKSQYNPPRSDLVEKSGSSVWTFRATGKGTTTIALQYRQLWDEKTPPLRTATYEVEVR